MGTVINGFNAVFNVLGNVSKSGAAALGALIEAFAATEAANAAANGGAFKIILDVGDETTALTTGIKKTFRIPYGMQLTEARASLTTASSSGNVVVDILSASLAGSIFSSKLQVDATTTTSVGSVAPFGLAGSGQLPDNDQLQVDITSAGTGAAGLKVYLIGTWQPFGVGAIPSMVGHQASVLDAATFTAAWPAGYTPTPNDVAILMVIPEVAAGGTVGTVTRPSGWTLIDSVGNFYVYWRRLDGTESAGGVSVTQTGYSGFPVMDGEMIVFRNCVQLGLPYEAETTNSGSSNVMTGETVTTLGANRLVLTLFGQAFNNALSSPDVGWTQLCQDQLGATTVALFAADALQQPLAGTVTADDRSLASSASWATFSLALIPNV